MTLTAEMRHAMGAGSVFCNVERRLQANGSVEELGHLRRFSDDELDILVQLERGVLTPPPLS